MMHSNITLASANMLTLFEAIYSGCIVLRFHSKPKMLSLCIFFISNYHWSIWTASHSVSVHAVWKEI